MCLLLSAREKGVFHFISHALSLCHQLVYIFIQQLDASPELWSDKSWKISFSVAFKIFYPFLSLTSSTGHLSCGFAPSLILSVWTCLYPVSHVTDVLVHSQLKSPEIPLERPMSCLDSAF